jgi:omega-amidase
MRDLSALPDLNIALVQTSLVWHDRQANLEHFELLLEQAKGADLIVLRLISSKPSTHLEKA